jgi:hypothetical protein
MSARVSAVAKHRQRWQPPEEAEAVDQAHSAMLEAADQIQRAADDLKMLNEVLNRVDKNVTAAAKRAVKKTGRWPLRLNSRQAKGK